MPRRKSCSAPALIGERAQVTALHVGLRILGIESERPLDQQLALLEGRAEGGQSIVLGFEFRQPQFRGGEFNIGGRVVRIELEGALEVGDRLPGVGQPLRGHLGATLQKDQIGVGILGAEVLWCRAPQERDLERLDDRVGDFVLDAEYIAQLAIIGLGPDLVAVAARSSCAVTRRWLPTLWTVPSSTWATLSWRPMVGTSTA